MIVIHLSQGNKERAVWFWGCSRGREEGNGGVELPLMSG